MRTSAEKRAAEEIANRRECEDFETVQAACSSRCKSDLKSGVRQTRPFADGSKAEIQQGEFFIVGGQKAYVAEVGEAFQDAARPTRRRLRVIYDNGTESNLLMRSLQRALHKDEAGRRITEPDAGPLFAERDD